MFYAIGGYYFRAARIIFRLLTLQLTRIRSSRASIHARYGVGTRIGAGSVVTDDVNIGSYTYINSGSTVEFCTVGSFCSISSGVRINPWEHNLYGVSTSPTLGGSNRDLRERVLIDDDCLISANAVILSGCHLGQGSVVGAGAVVTHNVMPYEVVGGIPAHHIKWRFDEEARSRLASTDISELSPKKAFKALEAALRNEGFR